MPRAYSPKDLLYPRQRALVDDPAQSIIAVTTRQWGKSTVTSLRAVHRSITDPGRKHVCMSAGERQSLEWLAKAREALTAYQIAIEDIAEDRGGIAEGLLRSAEIRLANGCHIIAIPANPSTARGYSADITLDEFAYHENPDAIWAAMFPAAANALAGTFLDRWRAMVAGDDHTQIRRDLSVCIVSTFNGRGNKFFHLYDHAEENGYSAHRVTIHDAIADGMPLDADRLRRTLDDDDIWAQEFLCDPMDSSAVLLPYDLIATCEDPAATTAIESGYWDTSVRGRSLYIGIDFARKRHLSVAWTAERVGAALLATREVHTMRDTSTPKQFAQLAPRVACARRVAVDYTGPGIGLGDMLAEKFGLYDPAAHRYGKIQLVNFTQSSKVRLFSALRPTFERREILVPIDRAIREDLHSMQRVVSPSGNILYRAAQTDDGHADRATALALCIDAARSPSGPAIKPVAWVLNHINRRHRQLTREPMPA